MVTWTIIILGATGDLARRRLIPTLYEIIKHEKDLKFAFIGAAKESVTIESLIRESIPHNDELVKKLLERSSYQMIDFNEPTSFDQLAKRIKNVEQTQGLSGNRLVYCSVASQWYCKVTELLSTYQILKKDPASVAHRIIYEKPFGWDAQSAQEINTCITSFFSDLQIYKIDHYLSKALVTSLLLTRFSNVFFEPIWNTEYIDQVQITLTETTTLEGRGDFYDQYGALKDVVQNHMLQLIAYTAIDRPSSFDPEVVSSAKADIIKHIQITDGLLGQFEGYTSVPGVAADSQRETYALLRAEVQTPRWTGVPFFIKTGKALDRKSTEIHIVFKPHSKKIIHESGAFDANRLIIRISPDSAILIRLNVQRGREPAILPISMEFCYRCTFGPEQPHSYETLFYEVMQGDRSATVSLDEITYAWNCIDSVTQQSLPLSLYTAGSTGPDTAQPFTDKHNIAWDQGATSAQSQ